MTNMKGKGVVVDTNTVDLHGVVLALRSEVDALRGTVQCLIRGQEAVSAIADAVDAEVLNARRALEVSGGQASNGYVRSG